MIIRLITATPAGTGHGARKVHRQQDAGGGG